MSNILLWGKRCAERIPEPMGRMVVWVPHSWRLGPQYSRSRADIVSYGESSSLMRQEWVWQRLTRIVAHAWEHVPFYRRFYISRGFHPRMLQCWQDISTIPIVTKADLQQCSLVERSCAEKGRMLVNTGGSSGQPLEFYADRQAFAREWAHMHDIWSRLGYRPTAVKLTFRGKNLGAQPLWFNPVHNEFLVNTYACTDIVAESILKLSRKRKIEFIHGYPSAIASFARTCRERHPDVVERLRSSLTGILFGSEYPAPCYRDLAEDVFGAPSTSWYGHSEMAVLAFEKRPFEYVPMQTYGYVEAVPDGRGRHRLVATSYGNTASPFIRYDTGDLIEPVSEHEWLRSFRVTDGRIGEFIIDRHGKEIPLTALIFGRHHDLFSWARFVQIRQDRPGYATVVVTVDADSGASQSDAASGFDATNIEMELSFEIHSQPIRTSAGKVPLLVR